MDFSDQIELGARLAERAARGRRRWSGASSRWCCSTSTRTPRSPRRRCCRGCSPARRRRGRGHPVTAVGDPNQAIYGWRGASVSNILNFGDDLPGGRRRAGADVPAHRQPALRPPHPRGRQPARRAALRRVPDQVAPLRAEARGRRRATVARRGASRPTPTSWPGWPTAVQAAHGDDRAAGREIGVLTRDNAHAADVFDALTGAEIPVEIVGLTGLLRLPEVAEVVATLHLLHDVTANAALLTLLTGPRWAIGPRDLRLLGRRAPRAGRAAAAGGADADARSTTSSSRSPTASTRPRSRRSTTPSTTRATRPYSPEARERFALLAAELRHAAHATSASRCSTWSAGSSTPPASTSSWPPSVSPAAAARRDNLDLFVKAVAEFQAVDGDVTPARAAGLPRRRGRPGQRPRRRHADRGRLGQAAHRAPRQGAGVGRGLPGRRAARRGSPPTGPAPCGPSVAGGAARPAARRRPRPARSSRGYDKAALDAYRAGDRAHDAEEELRLGYVAFTRAAPPAVGLVVLLESARTTPFGPSPYQRVVRELLAEWGEPVDRLARQAGRRATPNPLRRRRPVPALAGRPAPAREARAALEAAGAGARPPTPTPTTTPASTCVEAARVAEWDAELDRLLAEARRDRGDRDRRSRCRRSLSATALARLRDDPDGVRRATWPGRCRGRRRRRPGSAPGSTPGSRPASASRSCSTPTTCPAAPTPASTTRPTSTELIARVRGRARSPTGCRTRSRRRSRWCSAARWCAAGSTRSTPSGDGGVPRRRLEDQPAADRRPAPARDLPARLGRAARRPARAGAGGVLLRPHRRRWSSRDDLPDRAALEALLSVRLTSAAAPASRERDLDHVRRTSLALLRGGLLAGDDVVGDRADRQRPAAVLRGQRVERAGLHLDREHAVLRPSGVDQLGPRRVERVAAEDQADVRRRPARPRPRRTPPRSSPKSATGA